MVDPSPPSLEIIGTGQNAIEHAQSLYGSSSINHTAYQTTTSFSSLWKLADDQSGLQTNEVIRIGSYPGGRDIVDETSTEVDSIRGSLLWIEGLPHYVTVTGYNRAGVSTTASGKSVALDTTPPTLGQVCPGFIDEHTFTLSQNFLPPSPLSLSLTPQVMCTVTGFPPPLPLPPSSPSSTSSVVECQWSNVADPHSGITEFTISILQRDYLVFNATLDGTIYLPLLHHA